MNLLQLTKTLPSGVVVEYHGIEDIFVYRELGYLELTVGSWVTAEAAKRSEKASKSEVLTLHFEVWDIEIHNQLFSYIQSMPEYAGALLVDTTPVTPLVINDVPEEPVFDVGGA